MKSFRRIFTLLVVLCLAIGSVGSFISIAQQSHPTIGEITVSPNNPAPGDQVIIRPTFRNGDTSSTSARITEVSIRGDSIFEAVDDIGTLGPGSSVSVPFSVTFETTGQKKITATMRGQTESGSILFVQKPVYIQVEQNAALLSSPTDTAVSGGQTPIKLTISNGRSTNITGIELMLRGEANIDRPLRTNGSIPPGGERTFEYDVSFEQSGQRELIGEISYRTPDGSTRRSTQSISIDVEQPNVDVSLSAQNMNDTSGSTDVEIHNFGNTHLDDVEILAQSEDETVARVLASDVSPDTSTIISIPAQPHADGPLTVTASYRTVGEEHQISTTIGQALGEIRLTGVETTITGQEVLLEGDAANLGRTDAQSVLIRFPATGSVQQTSPSGEYFVGEVEASEFATFELTGTIGSTTDTLPVTISYVVGGERVERRQEIPLQISNRSAALSTSDPAETQPDRVTNQGLPLLPLGGLVIVILAVVAGGYRWRNE
jgi:hypothetical protein